MLTCSVQRRHLIATDQETRREERREETGGEGGGGEELRSLQAFNLSRGH